MNSINVVNYSIRTFCILMCSYIVFLKFTNIDKIAFVKKMCFSIIILLLSVISFIIKEKQDTYYCLMFQLISMTVVNKINCKKAIGFTLLNTIISIGCGYLILFISILISFLPKKILKIENDFSNLINIIIIFIFIMWRIMKIKKIKNGLIFLQMHLKNENMDLLLLNISSTILFFAMIFSGNEIEKNIVITMFLAIVIVGLTVKKSLDSYYKQTLLIKDLQDTKEQLQEKTKEVKELEEENLNFSKKSHSLAHKQKMLEYKMNQLLCNKEISVDDSIKNEIKDLSEELYGNQVGTELTKTGIIEIDDMLQYQQSECIKNDIEFELQIIGNIHYMINHYISKEELEILIADHVKDAIIAINHSNNINRSILVKLGEIESCYGLYIYDSGIEFESDTLEKLGKEPITTHADEGGTGMGFMNTFDTLRKHNSSLIIHEFNEPNKDDFTKVIKIKFDNKNEFKVESYMNV